MEDRTSSSSLVTLLRQKRSGGRESAPEGRRRLATVPRERRSVRLPIGNRRYGRLEICATALRVGCYVPLYYRESRNEIPPLGAQNSLGVFVTCCLSIDYGVRNPAN